MRDNAGADGPTTRTDPSEPPPDDHRVGGDVGARPEAGNDPAATPRRRPLDSRQTQGGRADDADVRPGATALGRPSGGGRAMSARETGGGRRTTPAETAPEARRQGTSASRATDAGVQSSACDDGGAPRWRAGTPCRLLEAGRGGTPALRGRASVRSRLAPGRAWRGLVASRARRDGHRSPGPLRGLGSTGAGGRASPHPRIDRCRPAAPCLRGPVAPATSAATNQPARGRAGRRAARAARRRRRRAGSSRPRGSGSCPSPRRTGPRRAPA